MLNIHPISIQSNPGIYKAPISSCLIKGADETEKLPKISVHDSKLGKTKKAVTNCKQSEIGMSSF